MRKKILFLFFLSALFPSAINSQEVIYTNERKEEFAKDRPKKKRVYWSLGIGTTAFAGTSYILYNNWYRNYPRTNFHFKNDAQNWLQMDKIGHSYWAYNQTAIATKGFKWMGFSENRAMVYGALSTFIFQGAIEIMDGHSTHWGFSTYDLAANVFGASVFIAQDHLFDNQILRFKYSYSPEEYSTYASTDLNRKLISNRVNDIYGNGFTTRFLKDYNGQTYWLSLNIKPFTNNMDWMPEWLNFSLGYGVSNILGATDNWWTESELLESDSFFKTKRVRQFYFSLDMDLSKLNTDSKLLRTLLDAINFLKMPFSAIEINTNGEVKFHLIQF